MDEVGKVRANPWIAALVIMFVITMIFVATFLASMANKTGASVAVKRCIQLCREAKAKGMDLSHGPCLSNNVAPGWVCDVAHWPRLPIDNEPQNQCSAFREGAATHFVEVDENCHIIRVV